MPQATIKGKGPLALLMGSAIAAMALLGILKSEEGYRAKPYRDIAGIWTVCYGDTENVDPNHRYTKEECDARLERQAVRHVKGVLRCTPNIRGNQLVAAGSLTYNIGEGTYCRSSVASLFNKGRIREACDHFLSFNKARVRGHLRVVKGLDLRRHHEREICLRKDAPDV